MKSIRESTLRHILTALMIVLMSACISNPKPPAEPIDVVEATIQDLQQAILTGRSTCRSIVETYLARIEAYDKPKGLNAVTVVHPGALAQADAIDAKVERGEDLGPLFCAPMIIKDNFDTFDLPTTGGSIALKDSIPPDDAFMVRKLREADAIILAKSNMAEWAFSPRQTVSSSYGTTANAYALDRVPAGSSGGTASAVAANLAVAGLGSDTGNSIRGPASHLSLFGIRSTIGLTSRDGVIPLSFDRDIAGPLTRTVEDAARIFNVVAGYDPADPYTEAGRGKKEADYTAFLKADGLQGARIGVLRALVDTDDADPEVTALFEQAVKDLQRLGAEIVDPVEIPDFKAHLEADNFCSRFRYDMANYLKTLGDKAPIHDVMEAYQAGQYSEYIGRRLERAGRTPLDVPPGEWDPPCPDYLEHKGRMAFLAAVTDAMDSNQVDALIYPTWTNPPAHLDKAREEYHGDNSQLVAPATGMPAVTVPMGFSYGNLPAGLQILGRPYSEGTLFKLSYAYEQGTHHRHPPSGFPRLEKKEMVE